LRISDYKFENSKNDFKTFLNEKEEQPRLSVLENYKKIVRVMNNCYVNGFEIQNKFKNRLEKDVANDEEFLLYQ